jgi:hypothetical protein
VTLAASIREMMVLQERLNTYKAEFESKVPPEKVAIMHRATEDLMPTSDASKACNYLHSKTAK